MTRNTTTSRELYPLVVIQQGLQSNASELSFLTRHRLKYIIQLIQQGQKNKAKQIALKSSTDVQFYTLKPDEQELPDDLNPAFIFSLTASELLSKIAKGEINAQELAKRTLENRGQDINGQWVGFNHRIA